MWYRKDVTQRNDDCDKRENQLIEVVKHNSASHEKLSSSIQNLTDSLKQQEHERIRQLQTLLEQVLKK
jgi:hypothetical protein